MNDSSAREDLDEKHEKRREQRIEAIKRWVEYIQENPPEVWGPQQNALINSQLEAARKSGISAEQYLRVERASEERSESDNSCAESDDS